MVMREFTLIRNMKSAIAEVLSSLCQMELWGTLAWSDTKLRYRRTRLGPFWVTLSTGIMVLSVGIVYGQIFGSPAGTGAAGYMPVFAVGSIFWAMISATLTEGCFVFVHASGLIKALRLPLTIHVYRMIARNIVLFLHNAVIILLLWTVFQWPVRWDTLLVVPALALNLLMLFGLSLALGVVCTRFRDVQQMVSAALQLAFLLTPIIWPPASLRGSKASALLDYNPLYYMIEVVRAPVLGEPVSSSDWAIASAVAAASLAGGLMVFGRFYKRVPYWL